MWIGVFVAYQAIGLLHMRISDSERQLCRALIPSDIPDFEREAYADKIAEARLAIDRAEQAVLRHAKGYARALEVYDSDDDDWLTESVFDSLANAALALVERCREHAAITYARPSPRVETVEACPEGAGAVGGAAP